METADTRSTTPTPANQRSNKKRNKKHNKKRNYDQLPEAFRPPPNRQTGLRDGGEPLLKLLPVSTLPHGLSPKVGYHYQPPRFYYGWPCFLERLEELRKTHPDIVTLFPGEESIDIPIVIGNIKRYTAQNLAITSFVPYFSQIYHPIPLCISVADSYFGGSKLPPQADVQKLQRWLGFEEDPMWYLDGTKSCAYWGYSYVAPDGDRYLVDEPGRHYIL